MTISGFLTQSGASSPAMARQLHTLATFMRNMPVTPTYPGVYLEELPSAVRSIVGVGTSVAAFVGYTARGIDHHPTRIFGFADFERQFGGLDAESLTSYCVSQFFINGGTEAIVVRVPKVGADRAAVTATSDAATPTNELTITARSSGSWGNSISVDVDHAVPAGDARAYNLTITDNNTGAIERFTNVTNDSTMPNYVAAVVNDPASGSQLVRVAVPTGNATRPGATGTIGSAIDPSSSLGLAGRRLRVTIELSATDSVVVTTQPFLESGGAQPTSIAGICAMLEQAINAEIPVANVGIAVTCTPVGNAIRIQATIDPARDARIDAPVRVAAPASGTSALSVLGFGTLAANTVSHYLLGTGRTVATQTGATAGDDGTALPGAAELVGSPADFTGMQALEKVDLFNMLCLPDVTRGQPGDPNVGQLDGVSIGTVAAAAYSLCERRRAVYLVDPPASVRTHSAALDWISALPNKGPNAAAYFPRVRIADPLDNFRLRSIPPSGTVAGLIARIDSQRGVWKAPAGTEASLRGIASVEYALTDAEQGTLNPLGLNCLRSKPVIGTVAWGARTLDGADVAASQWKYLPVRRLALMIEESLLRGTQWAVFEPNDDNLWRQLRLNIEAFMNGLFRQGAFQGTKPSDAYLVKCDSQTTTQADVDRGVVNVLVGFAPLKPAEFVIIRIQQLAGESPA